LSLPGELRNRIYELVLCEAEIIHVTEDLKPPALPAVCRTIRTESLEIWLRQNEFKFDLIDCDGSLLVAITKLRMMLIKDPDFSLRVGTVTTGLNWQNLKRWCRGARETEHRCYDYDELATDVDTVIYSALRIAIETKHRPWEECETLLEALRATAGRVDRRWLD
jgi:hypothetical protein